MNKNWKIRKPNIFLFLSIFLNTVLPCERMRASEIAHSYVEY